LKYHTSSNVNINGIKNIEPIISNGIANITNIGTKIIIELSIRIGSADITITNVKPTAKSGTNGPTIERRKKV